MQTTPTVLAAIALVPAIILCVYVYRKDRAEKEPIGFLLLLMGLGALSTIPAAYVEIFFEGIIDGFFSAFGTETADGIILNDLTYEIYLFTSATVGVALIEEGFKWLILFFVTRNSKHFNSLFDGLIYAVFVSLGFAALENVLYTFEYGFETGVIRAFTAVPGHMFDGVLMGYYYTMWNTENEAAKLESKFIAEGAITTTKRISGKVQLALSIIVPVIVHGLYDYFCFSETVLLFYVLLVALYITQFIRIRNLSKIDRSEMSVAYAFLFKKYPQLPTYIAEQALKAAESQQAAYAETSSAESQSQE